MRWNRLFIVCCSSLVLFTFTGCKRVIKIHVDTNLAPTTPTSVPGDTLKWFAIAQDESFDVIPDDSLCIQKGRLHAIYGHPAECTVAPYDFKDKKQPVLHTYRIEGKVNGEPFVSTNFSAPVGQRHCPYC